MEVVNYLKYNNNMSHMLCTGYFYKRGGVAPPLNYPTLRRGSGGLNPSPSRNFLKSEGKEVERKKKASRQ